MKSTKPNGRRQPVTPDEALQILQSAVSYCRMAGLRVGGIKSEHGLMLFIPGVFYELRPEDGGFEFHLAPPPPQVKKGEQVIQAIVYARSATSQADAMAEQIEACRAWAIARGFRVNEVYADGGSGNDPDPPQQARAIAKAIAEDAVLVCLEPSRLARDPALLVRILSDCERHGVAVYFVKE